MKQRKQSKGVEHRKRGSAWAPPLLNIHSLQTFVSRPRAFVYRPTQKYDCLAVKNQNDSKTVPLWGGIMRYKSARGSTSGAEQLFIWGYLISSNQRPGIFAFISPRNLLLFWARFCLWQLTCQKLNVSLPLIVCHTISNFFSLERRFSLERHHPTRLKNSNLKNREEQEAFYLLLRRWKPNPFCFRRDNTSTDGGAVENRLRRPCTPLIVFKKSQLAFAESQRQLVNLRNK